MMGRFHGKTDTSPLYLHAKLFYFSDDFKEQKWNPADKMYNPDLCPTPLAFLCCEGYMAVTRLTESCKGSPQSPYCPSGCEGQGEKQGRMCIYCILVYLLRALLVSEAASSALWGGFGVRAPHDGVFSSSMVQEYQTLPRFLPLLYKQLIDVPLFPLPGDCLKESLFL